MTATPEQLAQLQAANDQINAIDYSANPTADAADLWVDTPGIGTGYECRDYVLGKSKLLRDQGWPVDDMFVVLCFIEPEPPPGDPTGAPVRQYHAVLGCAAGGELFILDNRAPAIYLWSDPPYPYLWAHQQVAGTTDFTDVSQTGLVA